MPSQALLLMAAFVALLALMGYAYRVLPLYSIGMAMPMALSTAVAFEVFCLSALFALPDRGIMRVIASDTTGGAMARRLLPAAILIPLILGALRFFSEKRGYFETEFGISLFAVGTMVLFTGLIWWNARLLFVAERDQKEAERRLAIQYGATRALADSPTVGDAMGKIIEAICGVMECRVGAMWSMDEKAGTLLCVHVYHDPSGAAKEFADRTQRTRLAPGKGLPGRVWSTGRPVWIEDVSRDIDCPRSEEAGRAGLRCALGFPLQFGRRLWGAMEFFTTRRDRPDQALLEVLSAVGSQIGQFIERKHAEEQLKQTSAELERSNAELQQFAYIASHDLSEPLRMIVSYLQLLTERAGDKLDAESREFVGYAEDGAMRMRGLISDLLTYAGVGTTKRSFEPTGSGEALKAALTNLKVVIQETQTVVEYGPLPLVMADGIQLTQVFQNLVGNAIKFRGKAPPRIEVSATRDGGHWTFRVRDNGIGIDPRNFERIFVLFQRLHTRAEYSGTGMGLAICKRIIERHGGRLWVESGTGAGSTFCFTLPEMPGN